MNTGSMSAYVSPILTSQAFSVAVALAPGAGMATFMPLMSVGFT